MSVIDSIRVYLPKTATGAKTLAIKILHFLSSLREIDNDLFPDWYEQGKTQKEAKERKVVFETTYLENVISGEWDKKFPELGSTFSFWTGKDNDIENSKLNFSVGKTTTNKHLSNIVGISLPRKTDMLIKRDDERIKKIITLMKSIWNPLEIEID